MNCIKIWYKAEISGFISAISLQQKVIKTYVVVFFQLLQISSVLRMVKLNFCFGVIKTHFVVPGHNFG